jgi:hypothetical protein
MFIKGISLRSWSLVTALILILTACLPVNNKQVESNPNQATSQSLAMTPDAASLSMPGASPISPPGESPTEIMALPSSDTPTSLPVDNVLSAPNLTGLIGATDEDVNCRVGPDITWAAVGVLKKEQPAAVLGTNANHTWWVIDNSFYLPGTTCWVSGAVTTITGDITAVPVLSSPTAWVTLIQISTDKIIHGTCGMSNTANFVGIVTTNGPTSVTFHWVFFTTSGILLKQTPDQQLVFTSFGTQYIDPGSYSTDCGDYYIELIVTSPNSRAKQKFWSVVSP